MGYEENTLKKIELFAKKAHGSQTRKYSNEAYTEHLVRVMKTVKNYNGDLPVLAAALLHDILEDTDCSKESLLLFLRQEMDDDNAFLTFYFVEELTDVYTSESFPRLNRRKRKLLELQRLEKTSSEAQTIKYADIIDNCDEIVTSDPEFASVFLDECGTLLRKLNKGNRELRILAKQSAEKSILALTDLKTLEHGTHRTA